MKKIAMLSAMLMIVWFIGACKKDSNPTASYYPRFLDGYSTNCIVYDPRDVKNVKRYGYAWDNVQNKFKYYETIDTVAYQNLKTWPAGVTDPVAAGFSSHFIDRADGSNTYTIDYSNATVISNVATEYPGFPGDWIGANKIEGYAILYELYGASSDYSRMYFDFATSTYLFSHGSGGYTSGNITDLIKTPNGNMADDPIDWTKADASFGFTDPRYANTNAIIFIDYDEMKYVEVTRKNDIAGDGGRQTLKTTAWHSLSELFDIWKF